MDGAASSSMDGLRANGLACVRGDRMLFRDLSFALSPGEAGLVSGPNGAGKSSLLRLVAGLLRPFAGGVERLDRVALTDDRLALDEEQTLARALGFWARLDGVGDTARDAAMEAAGLAHLADVPVRLLSTGQRQRARLARAYQSGAALWLLDEIRRTRWNGLDAASTAALGAAGGEASGGGRHDPRREPHRPADRVRVDDRAGGIRAMTGAATALALLVRRDVARALHGRRGCGCR